MPSVAKFSTKIRSEYLFPATFICRKNVLKHCENVLHSENNPFRKTSTVVLDNRIIGFQIEVRCVS